MDKKKGIFENWLSTFMVIVFTQSFHAMFMVFTIKMIYNLLKEQTDTSTYFSNAYGLIGLIMIVASMAIIKFEKLIKNLFGINTSALLGGTAESFTGSLAALQSAKKMAERTAQPFIEHKKKGKELNRLRQQKIELVTKNDSANAKSGEPGANRYRAESDSFIGPINENQGSSDNKSSFLLPGQDGYDDTLKGRFTPNGTNKNGDGSGSLDGKGLADAINKLTSSLDKQSQNVVNKDREARETKIKEVQDQIDQAEIEKSTLSRQRFSRLGSSIAAAGVGVGATDDFGSAVTVANLVDAPLDKFSDKKIRNSVNHQKFKETGNEKYNEAIDPGVLKTVSKAWADSAVESAKLQRDMIAKYSRTESKSKPRDNVITAMPENLRTKKDTVRTKNVDD